MDCLFALLIVFGCTEILNFDVYCYVLKEAQRSKGAIIKFQLILPDAELHTPFRTSLSTDGFPAGKGLDSMR